MDKSFGRLLRHSRLASFDRTLPRVYTTPHKCKKTGDWGLKRNLPSVIRTSKLTVSSLDTAEHQTPWSSGLSQFLFLKRWKENFPNSKRPIPRPDTMQNNIAYMTRTEFKRLITDAKKQAPRFQAALANKTLLPEQIFEFLNVTFNKAAVPPVGPTYSEHQVGWNYPVEGRVLNTLRGVGFAVGISGIVALMRPRDTGTTGWTTSDRRQQTFYVLNVEFNDDGQPIIEVGLKPRDKSSLPLFTSTDHDPNPYEPLFAQIGSQDFISVRPEESMTHHSTDSHRILMESITNLLEKSGDKSK